MVRIAHAIYKDLGYMRGDLTEKQIELLVRKLKSLGVDIRHENHQMINECSKSQSRSVRNRAPVNELG